MMNMKCDDVVDYLNGSLTEREKHEFEEHLKDCADCREIIEMTGELPYLAEPAEPNAGMKERILANVFEEQPITAKPIEKTITKPAAEPSVQPVVRRSVRRKWQMPLIAAVLLLSLLGNAVAFYQLSGDEEPAFRELALQPNGEFGGTATAAVYEGEDSLNVVVQAGELAPLEGSEVYQVWLLKDGQPIPTGAFTPNPDGDGATHHSIENNTEDWDTIAITLEPQAGNETPQGEIVLSSGL